MPSGAQTVGILYHFQSDLDFVSLVLHRINEMKARQSFLERQTASPPIGVGTCVSKQLSPVNERQV